MITSRLAYSSIFSQKMEMNITMEDACSLTRGALLLCVVYQHSPWIHEQFYRGQVFFFSGLFMRREGSQASRLTDTMGKGNFHIILFKPKRLPMLDKCILKNTSYEIVWISLHM